jgi:hypothetical protein
MLSSMPSLAKSWWRIGNEAYVAGTLSPISTGQAGHCGRVLATNLSHDHHQSHRSDVSTLPTHVASCDDLEARLLSRVNIIGYEFGLHNFLLDRVPALLDSQSICELWLRCRRSARVPAEGERNRVL